METYLLRNGEHIPCIGIGTGIIKGIADNKLKFVYKIIREQIKNILIPGFKVANHYPVMRDLKKDKNVPLVIQEYLKKYDLCLVDTSRAYGKSEEILGDICQVSSEVQPFIISKITNTHQRENTEEVCLEESLKNLGGKIDVYMLHWPQTETYIKSYKKLIEFRNRGSVKSIGVANFNIEHLEELKRNNLELPVVNEFECHPFLQQKNLIEYCKNNGIQVIAYAPTGHKISEFSDLPQIKDMCSKYDVLPSQIIMRWHYQNDVIPIFNTTSVEHLRANLDIFGFSLDKEEMEYINSLDCGERYWPNPANCDFTKL